jgi:hypothetical protein
MKLLFKIFLVVFTLGFFFTSCTDEVTYGEQLKDEKNLIADFISRNNITVVETEPLTVPYPKNVYYKTSTGLYINITALGDTASGEVEVNDQIVFRFLKYTLETKPDTASYLNTADSPDPRTFNYYDFTQEQSCKGWHEAVSYMKYNNAQAKIIVYSKLGFSTDQEAVIPYGYDIYIKIRK